MNKYIKKCLIVYSALALMLVGMVGVTYAITATDADQYVTRSQYAVDMAHLQNKLDEAEAGLMGNINRFRSTDVKFVTFDTPDKEYTGTNFRVGHHNGGNFYFRPRFSGASTTNVLSSWGLGDGADAYKYSYNRVMSMYRLYNGNYLLTHNTYYSNIGESTVWQARGGINFAVPIENFPGWYVVFFSDASRGSTHTVYYRIHITKLDPNVPYSPAPQTNVDTLKFRFKKDLFVYAGDNAARLTTTPASSIMSIATCANIGSESAFSRTYFSNNPYSNATNWSFSGQVDPETGDYLFTISGAFRVDTSGAWYRTTELSDPNIYFTRFMPADNVEYITGSNAHYDYCNFNSSPTISDYRFCLPNPRQITNSNSIWGFEFVDCVNGLKYWHAWQKGVSEGGLADTPFPVHYSLPIVY